MATLTVRRVEESTHEELKARARMNARSVEAEVRAILDDATRSRTDWIERQLETHRRMVEEHGYMGDSVALIRAVRDEE